MRDQNRGSLRSWKSWSVIELKGNYKRGGGKRSKRGMMGGGGSVHRVDDGRQRVRDR